jgi:hypothetical protein
LVPIIYKEQVEYRGKYSIYKLSDIFPALLQKLQEDCVKRRPTNGITLR